MKLKNYLELHNISQAQFIAKCLISTTTIRKILRCQAITKSTAEQVIYYTRGEIGWDDLVILEKRAKSNFNRQRCL